MAIQTKEYELSVWTETLNTDGIKQEKRLGVVGAHDMTYLGRATNIHFITKLNGTHTLTFQMPDKYFDSEKGDFIQNELRDLVANERKVKLYYKEKWHEFYIKDINQSKKYKSYMYDYNCTDAYIDELSRNGYSITFDTELYNNVEEIGIFTDEILDGSQWTYSPENNIGDFTEYIEEKLFRIPVKFFKGNKVPGYKLKYKIEDSDKVISNIYTGEERTLEMGDDLARKENYYWDNYDKDKGFDIKGDSYNNVPNDGYIYVPYSQLDFCYVTTGNENNNLVATEEVDARTIKGISSYTIAPFSIDPTSFIQFIAIPEGAEVEIDENGLIVNKDYTYVMTVQQWNDNIDNSGNANKSYWYIFEKDNDISNDAKKEVVYNDDSTNYLYGNKCITYDGYLDYINGIAVDKGKKIYINDRTEPNISEEIDQYVTVYQNKCSEYKNYYTNPDFNSADINNNKYRVCSKIATRQIIPQLARNYIQNGVNIKSTDGWEVQKLNDSVTEKGTEIKFIKDEDDDESGNNTFLQITPYGNEEELRTIINFGAVAQEKTIEKDKIYCLGLITNSSGRNIVCKICSGTTNTDGDYQLVGNVPIEYTFNGADQFVFIKSKRTIKNPYICLFFNDNMSSPINIKEFWFFEAYTKGQDFFDGSNDTVKGKYRYSGRDMFIQEDWEDRTYFSYKRIGNKDAALKEVLFETDVMRGTTYGYKQYFIQALKLNKKSENAFYYYDTFGTKKYLSENGGDGPELPLNAAKYTEDDYEIITNYINLNACEYYQKNTSANGCDCKFGVNTNEPANKICMYQKYGYCPYLFKTEKHCRRTRTLNGSKSNRFNLTQELGKVFETYPVYYIDHNRNGTIKTETIEGKERPIKKIFYMTEKGKENKIGFRYEKNLKDISKRIVSDQIVTKLLVEDNDSELSKTGMCSIKTAEDNPSKDNFIIDLSYYIKMGMLNEEQVLEDLYGKNKNGEDEPESFAFLKKMGYYNTQYDKLTNKITNLQNQEYNDLEAKIQVNITGIETAQKELRKNTKQRSKYNNTESDTYKNYTEKIKEQTSILIGLIRDTFYTDNKCMFGDNTDVTDFISGDRTLEKIKEDYIKKHEYRGFGFLGQFNEMYAQVQEWKKWRAAYLKQINDISEKFYYRYEPYLKEGTWTNSNYLTDNAYYHDAVQVAAQGAIPKVEYNITALPLEIFNDDYSVEIADTTYIEDIGMFGVDKKTGLPNRLKVIISELNEGIDIPNSSSIGVQNFTTQFEDLFEQVTASVQSLTFNENIYKRSSNFTSNQNVKTDSLQGTLDTNELVLVNTTESNIKIDSTGQSGSHINNYSDKYRLDGQGLFFSNNGGETWNIGVGPNGINADYIKTGTLDAGKIRIVDNNYIYFLWDQGGITAYRDPATRNDFGKDFARFNKYGLSLVEGNKIRLRAGYEYKWEEEYGTDKGKITEEQDLTNQDIGFYLYDNNGNPIFMTNAVETGSDNEKIAARLSLGGEIYASSVIGNYESTYYQYSHRLITSKIDKYYKVINGSIPDDLQESGSTKIWVYVPSQNNYYETNMYKSTTVSGLFTKINSRYYKISEVSSSLIILISDQPAAQDNDQTLYQKVTSVAMVNPDTHKKEVLYTPLYYNGANNYYVRCQEKGSKVESNNRIGVYYNNLSLNQKDTSDDSYSQRLLSCVKMEDNKLINIFSVLDSGALHIGGTIIPKDGNKSIENLDSYIKIDSERKGITLTPDGDIKVGALDIMDYVNGELERIASIASNAGVPSHNHAIANIPVSWVGTDELQMYSETVQGEQIKIQEVSSMQDIENLYAKVYIKDATDIETEYCIKLEDLISKSIYEVNGATEYTEVLGGRSTYGGQYYTQNGLIDIAYLVVQAYYQDPVGKYYEQGNYISKTIDINGEQKRFRSRCDCSGLISAILQVIGDFEYGEYPSTYTMYSSIPATNMWETLPYSRSALQPGDIVLSGPHVTFISSVDGDNIYTYDFGGTVNLENSFYNRHPFYDNGAFDKIYRRKENIFTDVIHIDRREYDRTPGNDDKKQAIDTYFNTAISENFCGPYPATVDILNSAACKGLRRLLQSCRGEYGGWLFAAASYAKLYRATIIGNNWINSGANNAKTLETWLSNVYSNRTGWMGTANTGNIVCSNDDLPLAQAIYNNLRYPDIYGATLHNGSDNFKTAIIKAINGIPLFNGWVDYTWATEPVFAVLFNPVTDTDEGIQGQPRGGVYLMYRGRTGSMDYYNTNIF